MKHLKSLMTLLLSAALITSCSPVMVDTVGEYPNAVRIVLSDEAVTVNGTVAEDDREQAVFISNDIVYYEDGHDFTYGEGKEQDAHSAEDAASHTVVNITKPGTYTLEGTLSKGQIAIDLGKDAEDDPNSVVTLVLCGADITCDVAPGVIFYNVYECSKSDEESATKDVDTSAAGANVIIADNTVNTVNGSYVARIYKPESVKLSADGKSVEDSKKLHKYDGAFYSKMSMNIDGGKEGTGILNINAENEGLDSEMHLTINGGNININSGNDGINTNNDNISVTTVNGGNLTITVNGSTGEGDGIDSNGWLVINGGKVTSFACSFSGDSGIDSDKGIHIVGGTVLATGNMLDRIEDGGQNYALFNLSKQSGTPLTLRDSEGAVIDEFTTVNDYSILIYSSPDLAGGEYTLWNGDTKLESRGGMGFQDGMGKGPGGMRPDGSDNGERPEPPEGFDKGKRPEPPEGFEMPGGHNRFPGLIPETSPDQAQ